MARSSSTAAIGAERPAKRKLHFETDKEWHKMDSVRSLIRYSLRKIINCWMIAHSAKRTLRSI
jgi:hypothetical protein